MAAVALAWESQSTSKVGCSAVARQAARFTAVVVLPTPPFWFATAMMRAKFPPDKRKVAKPKSRCNMFHVEHRRDRGFAVIFPAIVPRGTVSIHKMPCPPRNLPQFEQETSVPRETFTLVPIRIGGVRLVRVST